MGRFSSWVGFASHKLGFPGRTHRASKRYVWLGIAFSAYYFVGIFQRDAVRHGNAAGITEFAKIRACWALFGRSRSRWFGLLMEHQIPESLRPSVFWSFATVMGIDLTELRHPLTSYKSVAHVFARTLKEESRQIEKIDDDNYLVVPCDGEIVNINEIDFNQERITQLADTVGNDRLFRKAVVGPVKGATFRVESFLGEDPRYRKGVTTVQALNASEAAVRILKGQTDLVDQQPENLRKRNTKLVYTVIYLAPHNYHHFHSPCEMAMQTRRHMPGPILPVFKGFAKKLNDLFAVNERVVLSGRWKYGQMHYAAVGAYNVGNIRLKYEPEFRTNNYSTQTYATRAVMCSASYIYPEFDKDFIQPQEKLIGPSGQEKPVVGQWVDKGERIGEFRMGSTIVLIFEVPLDYKWDVEIGQKVKLGEVLGHVPSIL